MDEQLGRDLYRVAGNGLSVQLKYGHHKNGSMIERFRSKFEIKLKLGKSMRVVTMRCIQEIECSQDTSFQVGLLSTLVHMLITSPPNCHGRKPSLPLP
ncbi:hypothetical protein VNO80_01383 [Phaseolus coccineus]|uniref:Uncharacterized protein n=1 Tax=Phaseolus coccineus TaxID=3886 RepID=A0AAN9RSS8_PHACN